jgi:hypothetical protein
MCPEYFFAFSKFLAVRSHHITQFELNQTWEESVGISGKLFPLL